MRDLRLALMCGTDIPIPECALTAHQPKLSEIAFMGETDYFIGVQCLCINQNMIEELSEANVSKVSNFSFFMTMLASPEMKDKKQCVIDVLSLIFENKRIIFTPNSLLFTDIHTNENSVVDENNFDVFQDILKEIFCFNREGENSTFNPGNDKAQEIARKLQRGRERVAAQKDTGNKSAFVKYISILTIGTNTMNIYDVVNLTLYQLYDLIERYFLHLNWDMDIRARMAGADSKTQPEDWMKDIH